MIWLKLLSSKMGRSLALIGGAILAVLTFGASQRRKGRKNAEHRATQARLDAAFNAKEAQDEVQGMDDTRVRDTLNEWMRDGDRD